MKENRSMRGVAIHEVGHHVVAKVLGFQVIELMIKREPHRQRREFFYGSAQTAIITPIASDEDLDTYLKRRIMVLNAGALAQAFDGNTVDQTRLEAIRNDNGSDDLGKAYELFALFLNRQIAQGRGLEYASSDQWPQHPFWLECEEDATAIVRSNWDAIERIVGHAEQIFKVRNCDCYGCTAEQLEAIGWPSD